MIRNFLKVLILVPLAIVLTLFAVANRHGVTVSIDPIEPATPGLSATLPLFAVLLVTLVAGVLVGGVAAWLRQRRWRMTARRARHETHALRTEIAALKRQLEIAERGAMARASASVASIAYRHHSAA
jgi:uncharacterized integral membrane protein